MYTLGREWGAWNRFNKPTYKNCVQNNVDFIVSHLSGKPVQKPDGDKHPDCVSWSHKQEKKQKNKPKNPTQMIDFKYAFPSSYIFPANFLSFPCWWSGPYKDLYYRWVIS